MNSNKNFNTIIFSIAVFILAGVIVLVYAEQDDIEKTLFDLQAKLSNTRFGLMDKQDEQQYTIKTEGFPIADSIAAALPDKSCILRIHDGGCLACYAKNFIEFYRIAKESKFKVFILGSYSTIDQFKAEMAGFMPMDSVQYANMRIYGFLPADSIDKPYIFTKGANNRAERVYIFNKYEYQTLNLYLNSLNTLNIAK